MKNLDKSTFDIEATTIRELNPNEIDSVGGGTTTWVPVTVTISLVASCFDSCDDEGEEDPN